VRNEISRYVISHIDTKREIEVSDRDAHKRVWTSSIGHRERNVTHCEGALDERERAKERDREKERERAREREREREIHR
jgi:hypothetical protein